MSIVKRGSCSSDLDVISKVYICPECGYSKTLLDDDDGEAICPKCDARLEQQTKKPSQCSCSLPKNIV